MQLEKIKNTKRNLLYGFINKFPVLFFPFVLRTVIIKVLGAEYLGLTSLFSSILQILSLSELGFNSAIVFSMYKPIADDNYKLIGSLLSYFKKVYFIIGLIIFGAGSVLFPFLPYLIKGSVPTAVNLYILYGLYLINTCTSYWLFAYKNSLLIAYQRNDVISNVNTIVLTLSYLLQIVLLLVTKNFYVIILTVIVGTILTNISIEFCSKKLFPNIVCTGEVDSFQKSIIKSKIKGLMISKVSGASRNALDSIILSISLGLVDVARYNNYYYILSALSGFVVLIFSSMQSGVGNAVATKSVKENYEEMHKFNFLYLWISGFCAICYLCLCQPFVEFFWGKDMLLSGVSIYLFAIYFFILRHHDMAGLYFEANGLWSKAWFIYILEAVLNIVLNIILGKIFGISGIVFATVFSMSVTSNFLTPFILFKYYFKSENVIKYLFIQYSYLIVTCFVGLVVFQLCGLFDFGCIINFVIRFMLCIILVNGLYFLIYFKTRNFKLAKRWLLLSVLKRDNKK